MMKERLLNILEEFLRQVISMTGLDIFAGIFGINFSEPSLWQTQTLINIPRYFYHNFELTNVVILFISAYCIVM